MKGAENSSIQLDLGFPMQVALEDYFIFMLM